jgi:signal transduction histidine kinase
MPKVPFTVSAKTARLIGQENFSNAEGAVIELVKNCYDADSPIGVVVIDAPNDTIYIIDNGDGMTQDIIEEHWMTIGTSNKENNFLTVAKRVKTGAKGIGRFALDRLGDRCVMHTKMLNSDGVYWEIDWSEFDGKERKMDEIPIEVKTDEGVIEKIGNGIVSVHEKKTVPTDKKINEVYAEIHTINSFDIKHEINEIIKEFPIGDDLFKDWRGNQGTIIQITGLRDNWLAEFDNDRELNSTTSENLYNNLESLIPPLGNNYFKVFFFNTQLPNQYGEVEATDVDDYDYKLHAQIDDLGKASITIWRNELELAGLERFNYFKQAQLSEESPFKLEDFQRGYFEIKTDTSKILNKFKDPLGLLSKIGAFDFTFFYIRRGGGEEKEGEDPNVYPYKSVNFRDRKKWLDKFGGIKIFRDNFRIRPYGEPKTTSFDWLGMGKGSANSFVKGGWKVKAYQSFGVINISRIGNINFQDKSNREGFQENEVFQLFQTLIKSIIGFIELDRSKVMRSLYDLDKIRRKEEQNLEEVRRLAEEEEKRKKKGNNQENEDFTESNYQKLTQAVVYQEKKIFELEEKQKMLQMLASAGLIVTSFSHELKSHKDTLGSRMIELRDILINIIPKETLDKQPDFLDPLIMVEDMKKVDDRLRHWLDFALASVRKSKRTRRKVDIVKYIEELERTWSSLLSRRKIKLTIDKRQFLEVYFYCHEIDLDSIFNNLLSNSADFLKEKVSSQREIKISFSFDVNLGISVTYEDNGPGLSEEIINPNDVFEPFFTTKRNTKGEPIGTGLGMWIVKEIVDEYSGTIEFVHYRPGIKLKLHLPTN